MADVLTVFRAACTPAFDAAAGEPAGDFAADALAALPDLAVAGCVVREAPCAADFDGPALACAAGFEAAGGLWAEETGGVWPAASDAQASAAEIAIARIVRELLS